MRLTKRSLPLLLVLLLAAPAHAADEPCDSWDPRSPASSTTNRRSVESSHPHPRPTGTTNLRTLEPSHRSRLEVPYTLFTLPNGLAVILHQDRSVPLVSVNMWYHVGSAHEERGRTGFAHLFEHLMFEGSAHVPEGAFDSLLEAAGGDNNGSTTTDRTNYWIDVPSNAVELALFLESDRMGYLLETMAREVVDGQRAVVMNERRQNYDNRPYGMAGIELPALLYPEGHPYRWPTIGHMEDLAAATYDDVVAFFKQYYGPNNASLVIAGDLEPAGTRRLVERWFSEIPAHGEVEPLAAPPAALREVRRKTIQDAVPLPRLYLAWLTPAHFQPGDAELDVAAQVLAGGRNSRLYRRLVYELQIAQDVSAFQQSATLSSAFYVVVTARPRPAAEGTGPDAEPIIQEVQRIVDEELQKLREEPPTDRELARAVNQIESSFYARMERVGGFGGKADLLNAYYYATGNPDYFNQDLARYHALAPSDIRAAIVHHLPPDRRVELVIEPQPAGTQDQGMGNDEW